jgi:hypothetical protein
VGLAAVWFSQWCGNFIRHTGRSYDQTPIEDSRKCSLHDDLVLFADGKAQLPEARAAIAAWCRASVSRAEPEAFHR